MSEKKEQTLGELALERGLVSKSQLDKCEIIKDDLQKTGVHKKLSEILVSEKLLSSQQVSSLSKLVNSGKKTYHIAGYELLSKVGQGGMGAVYKARQKSVDRIVALKVLPPKLARDAEFVERFFREARSVAKLNHQNIVRGIDVGESDGFHFFAMEFVDGESVRHLMRKTGRIEDKKALDIIIQITKALEHAHRNDLIHRDIKPDNILYTKNGVAKLADLGLAKSVKHDTSVTLSGIALGTPNYISPEQAMGAKDVDIRSDIYSLGATFYHMLTGQTPYKGPSGPVVMTKHISEPPPDIRDLRPELSDRMAALIFKAMAKKPDDRYHTPKEMLEDLEMLRRIGMTKEAEDTNATRLGVAPISIGRGGFVTGASAVMPKSAVAGPESNTIKSDKLVLKKSSVLPKVITGVVTAVIVFIISWKILFPGEADTIQSGADLPEIKRPKSKKPVAAKKGQGQPVQQLTREFKDLETMLLLYPYKHDENLERFRKIKIKAMEGDSDIIDKVNARIDDITKKIEVRDMLSKALAGDVRFNDKGHIVIKYNFSEAGKWADWQGYSDEIEIVKNSGVIIKPEFARHGRLIQHNMQFTEKVPFSIKVEGRLKNSDALSCLGLLLSGQKIEINEGLAISKSWLFEYSDKKDRKSAETNLSETPFLFTLRRDKKDITGNLAYGNTKIPITTRLENESPSFAPILALECRAGEIFIGDITLEGMYDFEHAKRFAEMSGAVKYFEKKGYKPGAHLEIYADAKFDEKLKDGVVNKPQIQIPPRWKGGGAFRMKMAIYLPSDGTYGFYFYGHNVKMQLKLDGNIRTKGALFRKTGGLNHVEQLKKGHCLVEVIGMPALPGGGRFDMYWKPPGSKDSVEIPRDYIFHKK